MAPREILIVGTGKQAANHAANHAEAFGVIFPEARLFVRGSSLTSAQAFAASVKSVAPNLSVVEGDMIPDSIDIVTLTPASLRSTRNRRELGVSSSVSALSPPTPLKSARKLWTEVLWSSTTLLAQSMKRAI